MIEEVRKPANRVCREHFFALLLLGMLYAFLTIPPLEPPVIAVQRQDKDEPKPVRVIVPSHASDLVSPYGPGFDEELLQELAKACGYQLEVLRVESVRQAWNQLADGKADVLVGLGSEPPANLTCTISAGPVYEEFKPVILRGEKVKKLYRKGRVGDRWKSFGANPFLMLANASLEQRIRYEAPWLGQSMVTRVNPHSGLDLILSSLQGGQASYALVDSGKSRLWRPFYSSIRTERTLSEPIAYRWYWRPERKDLAVTLNYFWKAKSTKTALQVLHEKYYGFLPKKFDTAEVDYLLKILKKELPKFRNKIAFETSRCGIDPLLYVALVYQESQFNPRAVSRTGARGLLQFTSAAASFFGLRDPMDGSESIRAGADYLKMLWDSLDGLGISHWDRWFFALAGYNQGKGHLFDAMALASKLGLNEGAWTGLKQAYLKLRKRKYAAHVRYGSCRGQEAVQFVDNIRYYYYILRGLVSLARPEAEHLGPLVSSRLLAADSRF